MEKIQRIGVSAFIHHNGKVLILRRSQKEKFLPGFWEIPGGKVEFGESPDTAVVREVMEETTLEVKASSPYSLFSYISKEGNRHTVDIQYIVRVIGNGEEIKLTAGHNDFKWIGEDELGNHFEVSDLMREAILRGFKEVNKN